MSYDEIVSEIGNRNREGWSIEAIVEFMRNSGLDVVDSITALKDARILGPRDAKVAVFKSAAWMDTMGSYKEFHDALAEEIVRRGWVDSDGST